MNRVERIPRKALKGTLAGARTILQISSSILRIPDIITHGSIIGAKHIAKNIRNKLENNNNTKQAGNATPAVNNRPKGISR